MSRSKKAAPKIDPERLPLLGGEIINLRRFAETTTKEWSLFNPSICQSEDGQYAMSFRSSNYVIIETGELYVTNGGLIRNRIYFCETNKDLEIRNLRTIEVPKSIMSTTRGLEDPKLFWRNGVWNFTATLMEEHTPVARLAVCRMDAKATKVVDIEVLGGWEVKKPEKNWMIPTLRDSSNFDYVYGPNAVVHGDRIIFTMIEDPRFTGLRGGSHLIEQEDGTYLAVMHKFWSKTRDVYVASRFMSVTAKDKNYAHYFVRFDADGALIEISDPFQFISRGIEFAAGMAQVGDNFVISFGKEDVSSHLCIVSRDQVLRMLRPASQYR